MSRAAKWDFFISYTGADRAWAEWVAWELEEARYRVLVQAWDFVAGTNWVTGMQRGVSRSQRTIALLSHAYLESVYGETEWQAAQAADPQGFERKLLPVRVEDCPRPGLLGSIVSIDLFGHEVDAARRHLLEQIEHSIAGRAKPVTGPSFPSGHVAVKAAPAFPGLSYHSREPPRVAQRVGPGTWNFTSVAVCATLAAALLFAVFQMFAAQGRATRAARDLAAAMAEVSPTTGNPWGSAVASRPTHPASPTAKPAPQYTVIFADKPLTIRASDPATRVDLDIPKITLANTGDYTTQEIAYRHMPLDNSSIDFTVPMGKTTGADPATCRSGAETDVLPSEIHGREDETATFPKGAIFCTLTTQGNLAMLKVVGITLAGELADPEITFAETLWRIT